MLPAPESNEKIPYILLLLAAKETSSIEVYGKMTTSSLCSVTLINSFLMSLRAYSLASGQLKKRNNVNCSPKQKHLKKKIKEDEADREWTTVDQWGVYKAIIRQTVETKENQQAHCSPQGSESCKDHRKRTIWPLKWGEEEPNTCRNLYSRCNHWLSVLYGKKYFILKI